ncbi:sorting nexin-19 [Denticeps clupeoides]|uniref:sorting nexin-19 n=1 Tax=Denticeps clupeoides TaxID=299321 RepID=UPI0010A58977|nr:sorting nexin-19-like [Denticeps clupeoides]
MAEPAAGGLSGVLGQQRKLLGCGLLLAWVFLFHLLVNIWLLCLFTSLLVVFGGWLGCQLVLESNCTVHLERFVTLERIPPSGESDLLLDHEIRSTVRKIVRDFVSSWYCTVSSEKEFEMEVQKAMISMAEELKLRALQMDRKALTERVLELCGCHLQSYMRARKLMAEHSDYSSDALWKLYSTVSTPHPALKSSATEVNYARAIIDLLLHVLVPPPHLETRTGRFVVGELITCNILLPLISKLSDPDWLNMFIVDVFTKSMEIVSEPVDPPQAQAPPSDLMLVQVPQRDVEVPSSLTLPMKPEQPSLAESLIPELAAYDVIDSAELYTHNNTEEDEDEEEESRHLKPFAEPSSGLSPVDFLRLRKSNPFYQENDSDLDSPLADFKKSSMESLLLNGPEESLGGQGKQFPASVGEAPDVDQDLQVPPDSVENVGPTVLVSEGQDSTDSGSDMLRISEGCTLPNLDAGVTDHSRDLACGEQPSPTMAAIPLTAFNFEHLSSPEGPVIIQNLRITGTITAKEHRGTGSHPYTLYTIKYETAMDTDNPGSLQSVAYHMVNRRYSEFLNLQTRLEEKPELRKILKNVKGPKKIFPDLPFGNMDSDKVEARKGLLETFLKQLCAIPETANSEEMQEFLALNTDARIAFVKKPFIGSRIDKIVVNAIVDTLKTAFPRSEPTSPTEEVETEYDGKSTSDKKTKSRLRFSSKITPVLSVADIRPKVLYCVDKERTVFNRPSLDQLEDFIAEQERIVVKSALFEPLGGKDTELTLQEKEEDIFQNPGVSPLADVALDVLYLLMREQWSFLCMENIQRTVRLLFGTLIDRWLDVAVANLMCTQYWVVYLRVLQEAVWPSGHLPTHPRPQRSEQQKKDTKEQSLHCLMKLLPDMVSDVLGSEKYRISWQTVLESLQDPHINRYLLYCMWDMLLEFLVPEAGEPEFQKPLLQSLSKNNERNLAHAHTHR